MPPSDFGSYATGPGIVAQDGPGRTGPSRTVQDGYGPGRDKINSFRTVQDEVVLKILGVYTLW